VPALIAQVDAAALQAMWARYADLEALHLVPLWIAAGTVLLLKLHHGHLLTVHARCVRGCGDGRGSALVTR
jgi:hypothetical protein